MVSNIFIFHGTGGHPKENWFAWVQGELEREGHLVIIPQFPTPEGQSLEAWLKVLEPYRKGIDQDTVIIGHSLGGIFLLRLLERLEHPIKAAFFVGTPIGIKPMKNYDSDYSFSGFDFNWPVIKTKAKHFVVYQSDDDPYVPLANGHQLAKELGVELSFIPNAGHFNTRAGYTSFQQLLKKVEEVLGE